MRDLLDEAVAALGVAIGSAVTLLDVELVVMGEPRRAARGAVAATRREGRPHARSSSRHVSPTHSPRSETSAARSARPCSCREQSSSRARHEVWEPPSRSDCAAVGFAVVGADLRGGDVELDVQPEDGRRPRGRSKRQATPGASSNCAALTVVRDLFEIEPDEWDDVLEVTCAAVLGIRAVGLLLTARGEGRIVNVSSDAALKGRGVIGAHYAASKAAVLS